MNKKRVEQWQTVYGFIKKLDEKLLWRLWRDKKDTQEVLKKVENEVKNEVAIEILKMRKLKRRWYYN